MTVALTISGILMIVIGIGFTVASFYLAYPIVKKAESAKEKEDK